MALLSPINGARQNMALLSHSLHCLPITATVAKYAEARTRVLIGTSGEWAGSSLIDSLYLLFLRFGLRQCMVR